MRDQQGDQCRAQQPDQAGQGDGQDHLAHLLVMLSQHEARLQDFDGRSLQVVDRLGEEPDVQAAGRHRAQVGAVLQRGSDGRLVG